MAKVFKWPETNINKLMCRGEPNRRIKSVLQAEFYKTVVTIIAIIGLAIIIFSVYKEISVIKNNDLINIIFAQIFLIPMLALGIFLFFIRCFVNFPDDNSIKDIKNYRKILAVGSQGEQIVAIILSKLSDDWYVFNDIYVNGAQIDHLLIGPKGIFCIETKTWSSCFINSKGEWFVWSKLNNSWVPAHINPAQQNWGHIKALKKLLGNIFINSIVVIAHPNCSYHIEGDFVESTSTKVCTYSELLDVIMENKDTLSSNQIKQYVDAVYREVFVNSAVVGC